MYYLSIDCANKSLAVGLYVINNIQNWDTELLDVLKKVNNNGQLELINNFLDTVIDIKFLEVVDLIPNKKVKDTNIIERTILLKHYINNIKHRVSEITDDKVSVLIEYQMNSNDKSRAVFNQLIYAFSDIELYSIHIVNPTLKNKVYLCDSLKHCRILQRYSKTYTANKVHCKENFLFFIDTFNKKDMVKDISKKNIDDIADTFMQLLGFLLY